MESHSVSAVSKENAVEAIKGLLIVHKIGIQREVPF